MKKKIIAILVVICLIEVLPFTSYAFRDPWHDLGAQIEKMTFAINENMNSNQQIDSTGEFGLSAVWIKIQGKFGIEVPWIAEVKIVPELEVVVEKN